MRILSATMLAVLTHAASVASADIILKENIVPIVAELESKHDIFHRIRLAETQLALVEEMSEAACMVAKGIEVEQHLGYIKKFRERFLQVHSGLLNGDATLDLKHPEEKARVIKALVAAKAQWDKDYAPAIDHVLATGMLDDNDAYELFDHDKALIDALSVMVTEVEAAYANPFEVKLDQALTMEILSHQEFLLEAIAKDVCVVSLGYHSEHHRETLAEELVFFENSQKALLGGMPGAIVAAPTQGIKDSLLRFGEHWKEARPYIDRTLGGGTLAKKEMIEFEHLVVDLLQELEDICILYENL